MKIIIFLIVSLLVFTPNNLRAFTNDDDSWHIHIKNKTDTSFRLMVVVPGHWGSSVDESKAEELGVQMIEGIQKHFENIGHPFGTGGIVLGSLSLGLSYLVGDIEEDVEDDLTQTVKLTDGNGATVEIDSYKTTEKDSKAISVTLEANTTGEVYVEYSYLAGGIIGEYHLPTFIFIYDENNTDNFISLPLEWKYHADSGDYLGFNKPTSKSVYGIGGSSPYPYITATPKFYVVSYYVALDTSYHSDGDDIDVVISPPATNW